MSQIAFDLQSFALAMKVMDGACGPTPSFFLTPGKGFCTVSTSSLGSSAAMKIAGSIEGLDSAIEIPRDLFTQASKGRESAKVTFENATLAIKQGSYGANVYVSAVESPPAALSIPESDSLPEGSVEFEMTPGLFEALGRVLPKVKIDKINTTVRDVNVLVRSSPKSLLVCTFDNGTQMSFVSEPGKDDYPKVSFVLPYVRFMQLVSSLPLVGTTLLVTPDVFFIHTKTFRLGIPLPAPSNPDEVVDPAAVVERVKSIREQSGGDAISVPKDALVALMENGKSLVAAGTDIKFEPLENGKGASMTITAARGSVCQKVKGVIVKEPFGISFTALQALLAKVVVRKKKGEETDGVEEVVFKVFDGAFVVGSAGSLFYVTTLSAMEETDGRV